jgi:hypothetical protein
MSMSMGNEKGKQNYAKDIHLFWEERERKSAEESSGDFSPRAVMMNGAYCRHGLLLINKFSDREQESGTSSSEE